MPYRDYATSSGQRVLPVKIEQKVDSKDDSHFPIETWSTLSRVTFMARIDLSANERFQAEQVGSQYDTRWMMPYRTDMDPDLLDVANFRRLVYGGRAHNITSARVVGNKTQIELQTATAGTTT